MTDITILTEADLREVVRLDLSVVDAIEEAFAALATRDVVMPPILSMAIADHNGEVDVKTAYVPGLDSFALKISPGFFDNPKVGLPSLNGLVVVFSARTGLVEAVLLDNGYLTDVRTAAAGAVAARHLAREDASRAAILGGGVQARLQLEALTLVRPIASAAIWARNAAQAEAAAEELSTRLDIDVTLAPTPEQAMAGADIVVTTTPAAAPLVEADWLRRGQHVTAMGSDAAHKNELAPAVLARADRFVCDRVQQSATLGELRPAIEAGILAPDHRPPELGEVVAGLAAGRTRMDEITVCDLTGTGVQDTAIATLARGRAAAAGAGTLFRS